MKSLFVMAVLAITPLVTFSGTSFAQGLFDPVIRVNERVVTRYELSQRTLMLQLFGAGAESETVARQQLIDERLYREIAAQLDVRIASEEVELGMEEFAQRGGLTAAQIIQILSSRGIAKETYEEFVRSGILWRNVVRSQFGPRTQVSEAEIDAALRAEGTQELESTISYLQVALPSFGGDQNRQRDEAERLIGQADTCLDLRAVAEDFGPEAFAEGAGTRATLPSSLLPTIDLLDSEEARVAFFDNGTAAIVMVCARVAELPDGSRDQIREALFNRKISNLSGGYLQELRGDAVIVEQ